jgi:hypothetical protein
MAQPTPLAPPHVSGSKLAAAHMLLYRAYTTNKLHLGMKGGLNGRRSPVHNKWENIIPYALILFVTINYTITMGFKGLVLSASLGIGVGLFVIPRWIMNKVRRRAVTMAFGSAEGWDALWRFGGLSMRLADHPEIACDSPDGDWQAFAEQNLSEFA